MSESAQGSRGCDSGAGGSVRPQRKQCVHLGAKQCLQALEGGRCSGDTSFVIAGLLEVMGMSLD